MFFFRFHVTPKPDAPLAAEYAGAYVSCWIQFKDGWGARALAQAAVDFEGWVIQSIEAEAQTGRQFYTGEEPEYANLQQAEQDGWSFVYECYGYDQVPAESKADGETPTEELVGDQSQQEEQVAA